LVTWALWLRAHTDFIAPKNKAHNYCYFHAQLTPSITNSQSPRVDGSFGLCVIASFFYLVMIFSCTKLIKDYGENSPANRRWATIMLAVVAFTAIFTASIYNVWSAQYNNNAETYLQKFYDDTIPAQGKSDQGSVRVDLESEYGVYTALFYEVTEWPYRNRADRGYFCGLNGGTESDGSAHGLVQSGRVVLGCVLTAVVFGLIAILTLNNHPFVTFYMNIGAFCFNCTALLVWSLVTNYIIELHCCSGTECEYGASFGLIAAAAFTYLIAIYYQAWVMYNDVYVLDSKW